MATARVSFAPPPSSESGESSPASSVLPLGVVSSSDEKTSELIELEAVLGGTAHLIVTSERLTKGEAFAIGHDSDTFVGTLDEAFQSPRAVIVKRPRSGSLPHPRVSEMLTIAKLIQVWSDARHPNVLRILGYTLKHENEIDQLIWPYLVHGNIRDFLDQAPVGVAQRLGFVRDVAAGLDYLHRQQPPICHGNLNPRSILIDDNLNAVLAKWGPPDAHISSTRYTSPESYVNEIPVETKESDVWAWGCAAFEILTDKRPFDESEANSQLIASILHRKAPGPPDMLLSLVPDAPKPEYASTLRLLHSYLPLCWLYEPKKRPPISLLRSQVFMFSFEDDARDSVVATLEELAHLLIPPERLRIVERSTLGEGGYGEVVLGILDEASSNPRDVAVKRLKAVGTRGERVRLAKRLARELNIWAKIRHPNVVELIGYYLDEKYESTLLISALVTNGNVLDYIERYKPDTERRIAFVKGITAGLACLHSFDPAICHANLKPANVLIDLQMNAVLCDFGLASFISGPADLSGLVTTMSLKGTQRYMSPELHMESYCKHNLESDVWAWACTVFQVLTNRIPYAEISGDALFFLAMDRKELPGNVALLLPNDAEVVDSESTLTLRFLSSILPQCWDFDPQNRPSICAILSQLADHYPQTKTGANRNKGVAAGVPQAQHNTFYLSSQPQASSNGNEDAASGRLKEETKLAEISEDPSGNWSAQGDKENIPISVHPEGEGANEENSVTGLGGSAIKGDVDDEAQIEKVDHRAPSNTSDHLSLKGSAQTLIIVLAAVCILSFSVNVFLILRIPKFDPFPRRDYEREL